MIDRTTWMQKEPIPKPKPVSNKILGIGIVLTGGVVLAVSLIIGLEFPRHVREKVLEDLCITGENHSKFEEWSEDQFYTRYTKLYYWTILNPKGFLDRAESLQLEERGPYVYKTKHKKINAQFKGKTMTFEKVTSQHFEESLTLSECGAQCTENGQLTVINTYLLKKITDFGSDKDFFLSLIPNMAKSVIKLLKVLNLGDEDAVYSALGSTTSLHLNATSSNTLIEDCSFGQWIAKNDTSWKFTILQNLNGSMFSFTQMRGLYSVLTDLQRLGVSLSYKNNLSISTKCANQLRSLPELPTEITLCGMELYLSHMQRNFLPEYTQNYSVILKKFLCTVGNNSCFDLPENDATTFRSYLDALFYFIEHLLNVLTDETILNENGLGIVITNSQKDFAFGHTLGETSVLQSELRPGILDNVQESGIPLKTLDEYTVNTCLAARDISSNMKTTGFHSLRLNFYSDAVNGYNEYTPVGSNLKACVPCISELKNLQIFQPLLRRDVWFEKMYETTYMDVHVNQLELSTDNFRAGREGVSTAGLQNITDYQGFLSWMSTPHFYGFEDTIKVSSSEPSAEKHKSFILVEDITGRVLKKVIRLQSNVGLEEEKLSNLTSWRASLDYFRLPFPVYWTEELATINTLQIEYYHNKVTRLMRVSCGGLIGIAIIAVVVVAIGVVITFVPLGLGRVAPAPSNVELQNR